MAAIIENPIYGRMTLETAAWSTPFTWADRSASIVNGINYASGGRVGLPGMTQTDVGTLNATFKDLVTPPVVGDLVRLVRTSTSEYAWVGYVQDVSQRIVFDDSVSYTTPVVLTTINCVDWVGYVSQFEAVGVGGLAVTTFAVQTSYPYQSRARALNNVIDATNATQLIAFDATAATSIIGDTDMVGTLSDHLDLAASTQNLYWYANNVLPTDKTSGRTGLVTIRPLSTAPSSGKTFTDAVGTAGQLHYTEIDFESSSQNVANTIIINNFSVITETNDPEVTKRGGGNKPNYAVVNGVEEVAVPYESTWAQADATSIGTYGNRASQITTNLAGIVQDLNLVGNPSMEYGDDGWDTGANRMARRKPSENSIPFAAYHGEWAIRYRLAATASTPSFRYSGSEKDGIPIVAGTDYMFQAAGLRHATYANIRVRAFIEWQNDAGGVISTVNGSRTNVSNRHEWYVVGVTGAAPANAERAIVGLEFDRASGSFSAGDQLWLDGAVMRKSASATPVTYFDGDDPSDTSFEYLWTGELGLSPTFKVTNNLDDTATTYLTRFANTSNRITRIRWNAQEDLTAVSALTVGDTTDIIYDGTTTTHRIVGIDGNISPTRYMIDYYLEKV